jgi:hypothetical protein
MKTVTMKQVRKTFKARSLALLGKSLRQMIREMPRSFFEGELSPKLDRIHNGPKR